MSIYKIGEVVIMPRVYFRGEEDERWVGQSNMAVKQL